MKMHPRNQIRNISFSQIIFALVSALILLNGCHNATPAPVPPLTSIAHTPVDPLEDMSPADTAAAKIVNRAKLEARRKVQYDASYRKIAYPGGDVPSDTGACTDVVIRSVRSAGYDLQKLIHQDILKNPARYPKRNDGRSSDTNIDQRRVPFQKAYLKYHAMQLPTDTTPSASAAANWQPGDLVYWKLDNGLDHCGIVSNVISPSGRPMVIHNLAQAAQEDVLTSWRIVAHYRMPKGQAAKAARKN